MKPLLIGPSHKCFIKTLYWLSSNKLNQVKCKISCRVYLNKCLHLDWLNPPTFSGQACSFAHRQTRFIEVIPSIRSTRQSDKHHLGDLLKTLILIWWAATNSVTQQKGWTFFTFQRAVRRNAKTNVNRTLLDGNRALGHAYRIIPIKMSAMRKLCWFYARKINKLVEHSKRRNQLSTAAQIGRTFGLNGWKYI